MEADVSWMLEEAIEVTKHGDSFVIKELTGHHRECTMYFNEHGRLLFNGVDIETEDFMAFVGLMDQVNDDPTGKAQFEAGE